MNVFEQLLPLSGATRILGNKLSGRIISRIADGFDDDPALGDMMNLFRCIEDTWPEQTLSLRDMYKLQQTDAEAEVEDLSGLSPKQVEVWLSEPSKPSKGTKLKDALPKIVDLYATATAEPASWADLTVLNQWSLLNATERGLHKQLGRYRQWVAADEAKGQTETNAMDLLAQAEAAIEPLHQIVSKFLNNKANKKELEEALDSGIRVPDRLTA